MSLSESFWAELFDADEESVRRVLERLGEKHPGGRQGLWPVAMEAWGAPGQEEDGEPPRLITIREMARIAVAAENLAGPQLPARKLLALSGGSKEGKTYVALEIMRSIASGEALFGVWEPRRGPVVYLDCENGSTELRRRMERRGDLAEELLWYWCTKPFELGTSEGRETFETLLRTLPAAPQLIVVDTLRESFRSVKNWNEDAPVLAALSPWRTWAQKNCTVLVLHHNNKSVFAQGADRMSGSTAIAAATDGLWLMTQSERLENGNKRWRFDMMGRGDIQGELIVEMNTETLRVTAVDAEQFAAEERARKDQALAARRQKVFDSLAAARKGLTVQGYMAARNVSEQTARNHLNDLVAVEMAFIHPTEKRKDGMAKDPGQVYYAQTQKQFASE